MVRRWGPPEDIGDKELIGRRVFDDPIFNGELDEAARGRLRLDHFMETREGADVSLDRLGRANAEKRVLNYLLPRCLHAANKFSSRKGFEGWAGLQVQKVHSDQKLPLKVQASPVWSDSSDENDPEMNIYHSHILIPKDLGVHPEYLTALHLKHLFERFGIIVGRPDANTDN